MNRAERRKKQKDEKRSNDKKVEAVRWVQSLSPEKATLIEAYAQFLNQKESANVTDAIHRCFSAAIIEVTDVEMEVIEKIMETCGELLKDDADTLSKEKVKNGGNIDMAIKKVNSKGLEVEKMIRGLIAEGEMSAKEIKETVIAEYPMLSKAMVTNAFKKVKTALKEEEEKKEIEDAAMYILEEEKEGDYAPEQEITVDELDKAVEEEKKNTKLKVVKEITKVIAREVEGEFGLYHIEGNVVNINEYAFMNCKDVQGWASETRKSIAVKIEELKKEMEHINSCENEAIEVINMFM